MILIRPIASYIYPMIIQDFDPILFSEQKLFAVFGTKNRSNEIQGLPKITLSSEVTSLLRFINIT